jgi:tRNA A37 methylthiotransferase MiaB
VKKDRSRLLGKTAEEVYHCINAAWVGKEVPVLVTEHLRPGSVVARTQNYLTVVLPGTYPVGYRGNALITGENVFYFTGNLHEATPHA